jgi:hypothetical protein
MAPPASYCANLCNLGRAKDMIAGGRNETLLRYHRTLLRYHLFLVVFAVALVLAPSPAVAANGRSPVIFVPGYLGSRLIDGEGREIFGGVNSLRNFSDLALRNDPRSVVRVGDVTRKIDIFGSFYSVNVYGARFNEGSRVST